jgi:hypothetical protein
MYLLSARDPLPEQLLYTKRELRFKSLLVRRHRSRPTHFDRFLATHAIWSGTISPLRTKTPLRKTPQKGKPRDAPYVAELTSAKQSEDDHAADRSGDNHQS